MDCAPGLQEYDFMEIDELPGSWDTCANADPNLNVTSMPEQLDLATETSVQPVPDAAAGTANTMLHTDDPSGTLITELSAVVPQTMESGMSSENILDDLLNEYSTSGVSVSVGRMVPDLPQVTANMLQSKNPTGPVTVTLFRPTLLSDQPSRTINLMSGFYRGRQDTPTELNKGFGNGKQTKSDPLPLSQPADTSTDSLPLIEPLTVKPVVQTPAFDLISPADSVDTRFTFASDDGESTIGGASMVSLDREQDIQRMAAYIRQVIEKRGIKPDDMSSKLKVHEVILVILLNSTYGDKSKDLQRILTFCDENGREASCECRHFKTLDTETMGLLWQKIKGNKKGNYDTFARAMRVRRERTEGFFEYLNAGKGKKKRIYRFGERSMEEMSRFKRTLRQFSRPQGCSY